MQIILPELYEEKKKILEYIIEYFKNNRMGYIRVPTGWGKTFLSLHLIKHYYEQNKIILFLVSRNNQLLKQTFYNENKKPIFPNSVVLTSENKKYNNKEIYEMLSSGKGIIIFLSLQTILSKRNTTLKKKIQEVADFMIIDEIHNFIKNKGNDFINGINARCKIFGMTATPFQGTIENMKFVYEISKEMKEIYKKSMIECILDSQLVELNYIIARTNQQITEIYDIDEKSLKNGIFLVDSNSEQALQNLINKTYVGKMIYDEEIKNKKSKTLVFCSPVKNVASEDNKKVIALHAKIAAAIFNGFTKIEDINTYSNYDESGKLRNAVYVSSELSTFEKEDIIIHFKNLDTPPYIVCTVGMWIEGFNFPELENLIILRPTNSQRLFEQQIGRVTRKSKKIIKEIGNIIEVSEDITSLISKFSDKIFNANIMENIIKLTPEEKLYTQFYEELVDAKIKIKDNDIEGAIRITQINLSPDNKKYTTKKLLFPLIKYRVDYFTRLLQIIDNKNQGKFKKEKIRLMQYILKLKVYNIEDAKEIRKILQKISIYYNNIDSDYTLSHNARKYKKELYKTIFYFLIVWILTYIKENNINREYIKEIIDVNEDLTVANIDQLRLNYFKEATHIKGLDELYKILYSYERSSNVYIWTNLKKGRNSWLRGNLEYIFWAYCFKNDYTPLNILKIKGETVDIRYYLNKMLR